MKTPTWSEYYNESLSLPQLHRHLTNMAPFIAKCMEYCGGTKVLEIGTGTGALAVYLSQLGYHVTGIDRDPGVIEANQGLNRMFGGEAKFLVADMFDIPFRSNTFDACYHQGLMEHFDAPDIVKALKMQTKICRRVIFAVPTKLWSGGVRGDERMWAGKYWHDLLSGFELIHVFGMSYQTRLYRGINFCGKRLVNERPAFIFRKLALARAGQIGFVISR